MVGLELEQIAMSPGLQLSVAEHLAELRHVDVDAVDRARRRNVLPERVDQAIGRDDLVSAQEEHCQQRPLLAGPDV